LSNKKITNATLASFGQARCLLPPHGFVIENTHTSDDKYRSSSSGFFGLSFSSVRSTQTVNNTTLRDPSFIGTKKQPDFDKLIKKKL
jgi:hypothetical protein